MSEPQVLEPWVDVDDSRRRSVKKATLAVGDQGATMEK
jgi:hypothetical protein